MLPKPYYHDEESGITIYCADCRQILPYLPKVDLVLTDPPYGLGEIMSGGTWGKQYESTYKNWDGVAPQFIVEQILEMGVPTIIWGGNYFTLPVSRCWLIHDKTYRGMTFADCEMAWTNFDANARILTFQVPRGFLGGPRLHPTEKPVKVMTWCLSFAPDAETILDPFMGSGTTLVAAKQLGKKCIGIEIDPKYCAIAVERLAQGNLFGGEISRSTA